MATSLQTLFQRATGTVSIPTSTSAPPPAIVRSAPAAAPAPTSSIVPTTPVATGVIPPWKNIAPAMGTPARGVFMQSAYTTPKAQESYSPTSGSVPIGIPTSPSVPIPVVDSSERAVIAAAAGGTPAIAPASSEGMKAVIEERGALPGGAGGGAMLAGAAGGFLVGGPIGAVVGAIVGNMISKKKATETRSEAPVPVQGFDGFSFKKIGKAIGSAVSSVGRSVDVTSRSSFLGKIPVIGRPAVSFARQAIATSAAMATGGLSVVAAQRGVISKSTFGASTTSQGFITGAVVGAAILGSQGISGFKSKTSGQQAIEASATSVPEVISTESASPKSGVGLALAGAGGGFLVGGPPGALVGAIAGMIIGRRQA